MAKKPPEPELHRRRITRIRAAPLGRQLYSDFRRMVGHLRVQASFDRVLFLARLNAFGAVDSPFLFEGPITRTVEDAAIALNVLAGYEPEGRLPTKEENGKVVTVGFLKEAPQ